VNSDEWKKNEKYPQYLFGIIQGGTFEDLRKQSAEFICKQNVDGVAIGGVSVGETKSEMREQVSWVAPYLPGNKPVHLLGVGQIDDVIELVNQGIDTFDCVEPTRVARMGKIYQWGMVQDAFKTKNFSIDGIDIDKGKYKADLSRLDESCDCYVCKNFTKSYLHHLLKQKELLGYTLGSYHNLVVMEKLMTRIREMIECDEL
jgi:tRNA-guanine transglycosylase